MSLNEYSNLLKVSQLMFSVGSHVHIYHDTFINQVSNNVLGKYDDHHVGKVVKIEDPCVHVQYGSETNIGIYDRGSLGLVSARIKPTAITKTGSLGDPSQQKSGFITEWSNFGKGDTVKVYDPKTLKETTYPVTDLEFIISESALSSLLGARGGRRVTLRNRKLPSIFTRILKRV